MSRLSNYSKFDHLDSDEEEQKDSRQKAEEISPPSIPSSASASPAVPRFCRSTVPNSNRFILKYQGQEIYEWEQSLSDVTLYIPTPPNAVNAADQLDCRIEPQHLQVGIRGHVDKLGRPQYFIDEDTAGTVEVASSTWTWERLSGNGGGLLSVELQKANKGIVWEAACMGPPPRNNLRLDPMQLEEERKRLLLERWQEENPGMDFRDACFNGEAPDPRTFMGGVSYS